jgi:hypothetical protein
MSSSHSSREAVATLVAEAERCFVCKKFRLSCARSLQALSLLVTDTDLDQQEQLLHNKLLTNLELLRQYKSENNRILNSQNDEKNELNCLAIIIQCLFELKQHEEAAKVLPRYYGSFEDSPFDLQVVLYVKI